MGLAVTTMSARIHTQYSTSSQRNVVVFDCYVNTMACKPNYVFSIDGHNLTVIEVDGNYVEPYTVDSIHFHAAQRYILLHPSCTPTCRQLLGSCGSKSAHRSIYPS
ncbi:Cu-oxidase-domain-containing protein [Imleria badia]|nr:Cu-oxidase-domain-containing protein [Imleria badia]